MDLLAQSDGGGGSAIFWLLYIAFIVVYLAAGWVVYTKAGQEGWKSLIPIYNLYILLKIVGRPGWWLLLYLVPFVNIVIWIIVFGRPGQELRQGHRLRDRTDPADADLLPDPRVRRCHLPWARRGAGRHVGAAVDAAGSRLSDRFRHEGAVLRGRPFCVSGAGDGNRTRIASLEGWNSAIELHPRACEARRSSLATRRAAILQRHAGALPTARRVRRRAVLRQPALRRARGARGPRRRHDAHARARDRVLGDDVRDRGARRRLRRAHLHPRRRVAVRGSPDDRHGVPARLGRARVGLARADVGGRRRAGAGRPRGREGDDAAAAARVRRADRRSRRGGRRRGARARRSRRGPAGGRGVDRHPARDGARARRGHAAAGAARRDRVPRDLRGRRTPSRSTCSRCAATAT